MHSIGMFKNELNNDYHKDNGFVSSSALKLILEDPIRYKAKYIDKTLKQESKEVFDIGNAFHTYFLEPDKFNKEYCKYEGHRRGANWEKFLSKNEGKTILGNKGWLEVQTCIASTKLHPDHKILLEGDSEISFYTKLHGRRVKVRFDKLNMPYGFGMDLKSTTGLLLGNKGTYKCLQTIAGLDYDLSAALYLDVANNILEKVAKIKKIDFIPITKWYWIFSSKDYKSCKILQASDAMLQNGRKKYMLALGLLDKYEKSNWETEDLKEGIETVDPLSSDLILDNDEAPTVTTW